LLETKDNRDGTRTFHWKMDQPHAAYLLSVVAGEFTPIESSYARIPVTTYVDARDLEAGKVSAARLADVIKFISEKTGVRYPYPKYSQVFVHDFEQIEGMENISASTITDLILQDARGNLDLPSEGLQVHEVAHQWVGDYVTPRTWADIWLSEGFAIYMQVLWDAHNLGQDELVNRARRNQNAYHAAWARGSRHPLVNRNYGKALDVFDLNAYRGGAVVLHMLRTTLGEENWWRAVRHFLTKYANQPVQTEQFRIAIEEATGQPLDWFFDQWIYRAGFPVLQVTQNFDPAAKTLSLTVRQKQKPDPDSGFLQAGLFRIPLDVEIGTATATRTERIVIEAKEEQSFTFKVDSQPLLVNFDQGGAIFKGLEFAKSLDELVYQLAHDSDLAGRWWAFGQLSDRLKAPATNDTEKRNIFAVFATVLDKDSFWGLRADAATALAGAPGDVSRSRLIAATKDKDSRVRAAAANTLRHTKDATLADVYLQLLNDQSYLTVRTAALALAETHSPAAFDALVKLLDSDSWRNTLRISALNALGLLGDKRALDIAMRFASEKQPGPVRAAAFSLVALVGKQEPRARSLLFSELSKAVTTNNTMLTNAIAEALVSLGDPEGLKAMAAAREKSDNPQVKSLLTKSEERLRQSVHSAEEKPPGH
jgi:aminopeptidase N